MSGPYFVTIVASNSEGVEWTVTKQRCETKEDFVLFQKALSDGVFALAEEDVKRSNEGKVK